jgi:hypothetical protein
MAEFQYLGQGNSEAQDKLATSFLLAQSLPGFALTGVLAGGSVQQTTTASGSVVITAGADVVQGSALAGSSILVNDTSKTLDVFTTSPVGGLPRNDLVVFDSVTRTLRVIVGVPNASPSDPSFPATVCVHARLRHQAGATAIPGGRIDDLRKYTTAGTAVHRDGAGLYRPVDVAFDAQWSTDASGVVTSVFDLTAHGMTRLRGVSFTGYGLTAGGIVATVSDTTLSAVRLKLWAGATAQVSTSVFGMLVFHGSA